MASNDNAKTFSLLEQPCALRRQDESKEHRRTGTAYDLDLADSDYDAAQRATRRPPGARQEEKRERSRHPASGAEGKKGAGGKDGGGEAAGQQRRKG
ncbi:hypothetical protein ACFOGJ_24765 [Marinibaculum pumilum]|uniref:Uncharacterized protein n=1 Tax=Marinibaculum pumilum TaxID=1766165 RepID=A0ABV7L7U6_9PROT